MILIIKPWLFYLLSNPPRGMALFPFVLLKYSKDKQNLVVLNHEKIHLRQQLELGILPFYVLYLANYLVNRFLYSCHDQAYRNICFEREAYCHESDLSYLQNRKFGSFWQYLTK